MTNIYWLSNHQHKQFNKSHCFNIATNIDVYMKSEFKSLLTITLRGLEKTTIRTEKFYSQRTEMLKSSLMSSWKWYRQAGRRISDGNCLGKGMNIYWKERNIVREWLYNQFCLSACLEAHSRFWNYRKLKVIKTNKTLFIGFVTADNTRHQDLFFIIDLGFLLNLSIAFQKYYLLLY